MQDGTIDISCTAIDEQFSHCSYLFLCAPISYNNAYLSQLKDLIHPDCILTDVGSVKTAIHEEITRLVWMQISSEDILWQVPKKADLPIPRLI